MFPWKRIGSSGRSSPGTLAYGLFHTFAPNLGVSLRAHIPAIDLRGAVPESLRQWCPILSYDFQHVRKGNAFAREVSLEILAGTEARHSSTVIGCWEDRLGHYLYRTSQTFPPHGDRITME